MTSLRTIDRPPPIRSGKILNAIDLYEELHHVITEKTRLAIGLFEECLSTGDNLILDVPCGTGKSVGMTIVAAALASRSRRMWFVAEKVTTVLAVTEKLNSLGANAKAWHSYNKESCKADPKPNYKTVRSPESPCPECQHRHDCTSYIKMTQRDMVEPHDADIVVTTHVHWRNVVESDSLPGSVRHVIVDEAPAIFEMLTLGHKELLALRHTLCSGKSFTAKFDSWITGHKDLLSEGSCRKIGMRIDSGDIASMKSGLAQRRKDSIYSDLVIPLTDIGSEAAYELAYRFIRMFSAGDVVYGFADCDRDGLERMSFIRDSMPEIRGAQTLILDGSASLSQVRWSGFEMLSCEAFGNEYPNMEIHIVDRSCTQTSLQKEEVVDALGDIARRWNGGNLLAIANKDLSSKELHDLDLMLWCTDCKRLDVGEHVGSNKGRECDACLVAGAFFTGLADVVLRTALASESDIERSRIWKGPYPKMGSRGFHDPELDATLTRILVRELEQAFNRGTIRNDPSAPYLAAAVVGGQAAAELVNRFPGATVRFYGSSLIGMLMEGISLNDIAESMDGSMERNKKRAAAAARRLCG